MNLSTTSTVDFGAQIGALELGDTGDDDGALEAAAAGFTSNPTHNYRPSCVGDEAL